MVILTKCQTVPPIAADQSQLADQIRDATDLNQILPLLSEAQRSIILPLCRAELIRAVNKPCYSHATALAFWAMVCDLKLEECCLTSVDDLIRTVQNHISGFDRRPDDWLAMHHYLELLFREMAKWSSSLYQAGATFGVLSITMQHFGLSRTAFLGYHLAVVRNPGSLAATSLATSKALIHQLAISPYTDQEISLPASSLFVDREVGPIIQAFNRYLPATEQIDTRPSSNALERADQLYLRACDTLRKVCSLYPLDLIEAWVILREYGLDRTVLVS
jgi:hypothetical protein